MTTHTGKYISECSLSGTNYVYITCPCGRLTMVLIDRDATTCHECGRKYTAHITIEVEEKERK